MQTIRWAFASARLNAGKSKAARMAMMAMTTNNSIKVNASPDPCRTSHSTGLFRWLITNFNYLPGYRTRTR